MINRVEIEGLDRTGKDTLMRYIDYMSNRTMVVKTRGLLSTLAYAEIFERELSTNRIEQMINGNKDTLIIYLTADLEDWQIRMKMTDHPNINVLLHNKVFENWKETLIAMGIQIKEFNTTQMTPYQIAKQIIELIDKENEV